MHWGCQCSFENASLASIFLVTYPEQAHYNWGLKKFLNSLTLYLQFLCQRVRKLWNQSVSMMERELTFSYKERELMFSYKRSAMAHPGFRGPSSFLETCLVTFLCLSKSIDTLLPRVFWFLSSDVNGSKVETYCMNAAVRNQNWAEIPTKLSHFLARWDSHIPVFLEILCHLVSLTLLAWGPHSHIFSALGLLPWI